MRVIFAGRMASVLASGWVRTLQLHGHSVAICDARMPLESPEVYESWGVGDVPRFSLEDAQGAEDLKQALDGAPDIVFGWWGLAAVDYARSVRRWFPDVPAVVCVDTFPNSATLPAEIREVVRWRSAARHVQGLVFSSPTMATAFSYSVRHSASLPMLACVQPMPAASHFVASKALPQKLRLRHCDRPRIIFPGRADLLWTKDPRMKKDRLGPHLRSIVDSGVEVHVGVHRTSGGSPASWLHGYPEFTVAQILDGTFATFVAQFDAQLVVYNEANRTLRRRVRGGLSTRYAVGLISPAPLAVSPTSEFVWSEWGAEPVGFAYASPDDLAATVSDGPLLDSLRRHWQAAHERWTSEAMKEPLSEFFDKAVASHDPAQ